MWDMGRRKNDNSDIFGLAGPLAALGVLGVMLFQEIRQALQGLIWIVYGIIGVFLVFCVARLLHRYFNRHPVLPVRSYNFDAVVLPPQPHPAQSISPVDSLFCQLRTIDWFQFEKLVERTYAKLNYHVTRQGGANPDGGIDLILEQNGQRIAVQCKQWKAWNVGVKEVREFLGALKHAQIDQGIFITLKGFTGPAKLLAEQHRIEIIDEAGLTELLERTNAHFDPATLAILRDEQKYCPKCESKMVRRTAQKGANAGNQFWGCSKYPRCRFILPA
jgi:restriction system protein